MAAFPGRRPQTLLELDLTEPLVAPSRTIRWPAARPWPSLRPTLRALHEAAEDRHVVGLIAKVGGCGRGQRCRSCGAASGIRGERQADAGWAESWRSRVARHGGLRLGDGFRRTVAAARRSGPARRRYRDALRTRHARPVGIEPQFEQRHEYKNAADLWLRKEFTAAHREALERLAESVFSDAVETIADARGLTMIKSAS